MSVLAKEIQKEFALSQEYIEAGFQHLLKAGEQLAEVEALAGAEQVEAWLNENCSGIDTAQAIQSLRLFKGETIKVEAHTKTEQKEVQEN
jgi:hypothetical protein